MASCSVTLGAGIPGVAFGGDERPGTIGEARKNGVMTEECLFWDNQEFMTQIGLGK
jgi:hypothetical protein